jgi:hypothetical protein
MDFSEHASTMSDSAVSAPPTILERINFPVARRGGIAFALSRSPKDT